MTNRPPHTVPIQRPRLPGRSLGPQAQPSGPRRAPCAGAALGLRMLAALLLATPLSATAQATGPAAAPGAPAAAAPSPDDPAQYLVFERDFAANCVMRNGVQILVRNRHPSRTLRVWMDRIHMGVGTGDRSRSELKPGAEPEALGCSRTDSGPQEWRLVRAVFVE